MLPNFALHFVISNAILHAPNLHQWCINNYMLYKIHHVHRNRFSND